VLPSNVLEDSEVSYSILTSLLASNWNSLEGLLNVVRTIPTDYVLVWSTLVGLEVWALRRNWTRWLRNEYNHQFDHNIGVGNLKDSYENGNYGFDPLKLASKDAVQYRTMQERELNHGRLAMIASIGMIVQEYTTGLPVLTALSRWLSGEEQTEVVSFDLVGFLFRLPVEFIDQMKRLGI